jgi:polysaccharide biosynthesis protein PslH
MKVLLLSRWLPYPPDNGSRIRVFNVLKQLAQAHEVALVSFTDRAHLDRSPEALAALSGYCSDVWTVPHRDYRPCSPRALAGIFALQPRSLIDTHSGAMRATALRAANRLGSNVVVASELAMAPYALALRGLPRLLDDLELSAFSDTLRPNQRLPGRLRRRLTWLKLSAFLRRILPEFAACTVVSESERCNVQRAAPRYSRVRVIPNAVEGVQYAGSYGQPQPNSLVFAGSLTYQANYDAVRYCLESIYPEVARAVPDVQLRVTGSTDRVQLGQLPRHRGVIFTGHLSDIRSTVANSWASIVPLRAGGGTRLKILESMSLGTPVVSTPKGAEGLDVADGENILLAETPRQFAQRVVELLGSAELRTNLAAAGKQLVASRYDWSVVGRDLRGLVEEVRD